MSNKNRIRTAKIFINGLDKLHFWNKKNPLTKNKCNSLIDTGEGILLENKINNLTTFKCSKEKINRIPVYFKNIFNNLQYQLASELKYEKKLRYNLLEDADIIGFPSTKNIAYSIDNIRVFEILKISPDKSIYVFAWDEKHFTRHDAQEIFSMLFDNII